MHLPLTGIRVADFTRVLTGPYCTMLLGDLGADVIKIEPPQGDDTRSWTPPAKGTEATYFLSVNRNKRSVVLNLKDPQDLQIARKLIASSDVLVENYRPGTMEKLGLGYETLKALKPRLIYAAISGFGQTGPYASLSGYDVIAQGMGGLMSYTGAPDGEPMKLGVAVADVFAGSLLTQAICAVLYEREKTGMGRRIDVNLLEGMLSLGTYQISRYLNASEVAERLGNEHRSIVPYGMFACKDGHFNLAVGNDALWLKFCQALSFEDLLTAQHASNAGRVQHREALMPELLRRFAGLTRAELLEKLQQAGVPCGPVYDVREALEDLHITARGVVQEVPHHTLGTVKTTAPPWELDGMHPPVRQAPPTLGQHTEEILEELENAGLPEHP
ncbi:CaiB/BaiF CoA transferase family protein [Deinococcus roseus]|uniref:CoA transferase n=1 Tax=Deinococcus roseus TaxID=392414 RepID=A0ABQ2D9A2_9DEIO|nr:CoA transferase [Deinococcus roseus]GGJ49382.1 CoA transferase [Deinococcus roseus]